MEFPTNLKGVSKEIDTLFDDLTNSTPGLVMLIPGLGSERFHGRSSGCSSKSQTLFTI
tara:strand:- start:93 stop:266 length:174 start_codon:yes stop_codon:yes gene_type:complete